MQPSAPSITEPLSAVQRPRLVRWVLLSAVLTTLAYPSPDLGLLAWLCLAPLFWALPRARRMRGAFGLGVLFGWAHWGVAITWLGTTVSIWSESNLGWLAWAGLTAVKSLWFGLFGAVAWVLGRRCDGLQRSLGIAAAWTIIEWLRTLSGLAMPWLLIGYTQYRCLPLLQSADVAGVFGVGFLVCLVNGSVAEAVRRWLLNGERPTVLPVYLFRALVLPLVLLPTVCCYGLIRLAINIPGSTVRISVVQPNIQTRRFDTTAPAEAFEQYRVLAAKAASQKPLMVVWPESAGPLEADHTLLALAPFAQIARETGVYHLVGTGFRDEANREYNSAFAIAPDGSAIARYDKRRLVPFGEWIPARPYIPLKNVFKFRDEDVSSGANGAPLRIGPISLGTLICYESVFPDVSRAYAASGANLLALITNDSWAGRSSELQQHMAMTVFRAVETRRWVATSATTGITGIIDPYGGLKALPPYESGVLTSEVRLLTGTTLYVRYGDWFVGVCGFLLAWALVRRRREPRT